MRAVGAKVAMLVVAFGIGGCASFKTRDAKLAGVKTIGIISALGDELTLAKGGLTGLDGRSQRFPISSWNLDQQIVQQATTALGGRYQVQPVSYTRDAFAKLETDTDVIRLGALRRDPFKKLVESAVSPQGLDAYVIITKAKTKFGPGSRKIEGIGLLSYHTMMASYYEIHAVYEVRVYDGKSFDLIEKIAAPPLEDGGTVRIAGPSRMVDESLSQDGNPAENEKLHAAVTDLVARSLSSTLGDLRLANKS